MPYMHFVDLPKTDLVRFAQEIACAINWRGYQCWITGGFVRDLLLEVEPGDLDMMTPMSVKGMKLLDLPDCSVVPTGEQYGTLTFVRGDLKIEVTTCREDFGDQDAGDNRKDVTPTFIHKNTVGPVVDVNRRDLTINGLYMCPFRGLVYDYVDGTLDLFAKQITFIGDALDRCREDALRVFRFIRFAARFLPLGFTIDPVIFDVVNDPVVQTRLGLLSAERVRDEFIKTLTVKSGNAAAWAMTMYHELGLLDMWFPEMVPMVDHEQNVYHSHDVWGHSLLAVEASERDLINRLFALWHDVGKPECAEFKHEDYGFTFHQHTAASARIMRKIAERLKFGHREPVHMDLLYHLIEHHMDAFINGKMSKIAKRMGLHDFAEDYGAKAILDLAWSVGRSDWFGRVPNMDVKDIRGADARLKAVYDRVAEYIEGMQNPVFSARDLTVTGHDVMRVTEIPPGPQVGQVIRQLFIHVQNGLLPNEKEALEAAMLDMPTFEGDE
jgi:tRNA nucleotidyltransferase (CCA-adding enzyme)